MSVIYVDAVSEQLPASDTTIYTCPAGKTAIITYGIATCEDATGTTLTTNIVRSGGAAAVTNIYGYGGAAAGAAISAAASERLSKLEGACLQAGGFISCKAGDAARLNIKFTIKEIS